MESKVKVFDCSGNVSSLACVARTSFGKNPIESLENGFLAKDEFEKDIELVKKCYRLGHLSIFEFAHITYFIECPIFVARQLMRYRCASYIERSLRRVEPEQIPAEDCQEEYDKAYNHSVNLYKSMKVAGYPKEQARAVLTLATPTQFLMKVNLRSLFHIFDERLKKEAQKETRECVAKMFKNFNKIFPEIAGILLDEKNFYEFLVKEDLNERD